MSLVLEECLRTAGILLKHELINEFIPPTAAGAERFEGLLLELGKPGHWSAGSLANR